MAHLILAGRISTTLVQRMKTAAERSTYDGQLGGGRYLDRCRHYCSNTSALMIFTRDIGMHTSGWWKNPDYERCYHLSISFAAREQAEFFPLPHNHKVARRWCEAIFHDRTKLLWIEPPFSEHGKARDVYHYRLFCDEAWQPTKPRGEVYSKDWTPADWKSWSDIHGAEAGENFGSEIVRAPEARSV